MGRKKKIIPFAKRTVEEDNSTVISTSIDTEMTESSSYASVDPSDTIIVEDKRDSIISSLSSENNILTNEVNKLNSDIIGYKKQITDLKNRFDTNTDVSNEILQKKITDLENQLDNSLIKNSEISFENARLETVIKELKNQNDQLKKIIEVLKRSKTDVDIHIPKEYTMTYPKQRGFGDTRYISRNGYESWN